MKHRLKLLGSVFLASSCRPSGPREAWDRTLRHRRRPRTRSPNDSAAQHFNSTAMLAPRSTRRIASRIPLTFVRLCPSSHRRLCMRLLLNASTPGSYSVEHSEKGRLLNISEFNVYLIASRRLTRSATHAFAPRGRATVSLRLFPTRLHSQQQQLAHLGDVRSKLNHVNVMF